MKIGKTAAREPVSLYIHVPFCSRKCDYCHFYVIPDKKSHIDLYLEGLEHEWGLRRSELEGKQLVSVYFGGGTPSKLDPKHLEKILFFLKQSPAWSDAMEITLEANPEDVTLEHFQAYRALGINRVSLGVQCFDDKLLRSLGRTHSAAISETAVHTIVASGIKNISIDLMYDLPGQDLQSWKDTLERSAALPITHLSLYNLTLEPHTVFFKKRKSIQSLQPSDEESLSMLQSAVEHLERSGLQRYEISAFAKEGCISQHNSGYWKARPFLGLGPSAFSHWEGRRFRNHAHINKWHRGVCEGRDIEDYSEILEAEAQWRELFAVELRLLKGIEIKDFQERHGVIPQGFSHELQSLAQQDLLHWDGHVCRLSENGRLFYDHIAAELV